MLEHRAVLLIDDDLAVRRYLTQLLEKQGWKVTPVRSGSEALTALAAFRYDIVLCDLDFGPGINGLEVFSRLPESARDTPFIILTGHGTIDRYREAVRCGVADFLEKPISAAKLFSAIDRALGVTPSTVDEVALDQSKWRDTIGDRHVRGALRKIEREFANPDFSVEALAKSIPVTPDHLARLFRVHLARKPLEKIHETRIRASEKLLDSLTLSMYEVAVDCGYRTTTEFDVWFRHFNGMTPTEWRARKGPRS